ncbi:MAG: class I SAM-dependent methyltransferase [Treponematales bacterium]
MGKIADFHRNYVKVTPPLVRAVIRPFWRLFWIPYSVIRFIRRSKPCIMMAADWKRAGFVYNKTRDYVRYSSLELAAREIYANRVPGNAAELGVFQGDFARCINEVFPDRRLYLFDTFEGFAGGDLETERKKGLYVPEAGTFADTSVELVLKRMPHRENCVIHQGYFPETARGLDDRFAFVSLDADLSEPIYQGLCWFYPRLEKGGYIFVHDFNHALWTGAKAGVKRFAAEYGVSYFPLSDGAGSAVFIK